MQMQQQQRPPPPRLHACLFGFIAGATIFANALFPNTMLFPARLDKAPLRHSNPCVQSTMSNKDAHSLSPPAQTTAKCREREASERTNLHSKTALAIPHTIVAKMQTERRAASRECLISAVRQTNHTIVFSRLRLLRHSPINGDRSPRLRFGCAPGHSRNSVESRSRRD